MAQRSLGVAFLSSIVLGVSILLTLHSGCSSSSTRFASRPESDSSSAHAGSVQNQDYDVHRKSGEEDNESERFGSDDENNFALDRHEVLTAIMAMMGTPYDYSGTDSNGIDCSGFTGRIYHDIVGRNLPHSTRDQFMLGTPVARQQLKFGDLVFFKTTGDDPSHVGIYVGDGLFAHASLSLGVTISLLRSAYYMNRYTGARRIVE